MRIYDQNDVGGRIHCSHDYWAHNLPYMLDWLETAVTVSLLLAYRVWLIAYGSYSFNYMPVIILCPMRAHASQRTDRSKKKNAYGNNG